MFLFKNRLINKTNTKSKAVIMAAGSGERWENYTGVPKQMVKINNEPLLHRTIRLLKKNGIREIYVTVPEINYFGELEAEQIKGESFTELDKFFNAEQHQDAIFLWGDVFFTEKAMKKICKNRNDLIFFGRRHKSVLTGKKWGEIFAVKTNAYFFKKAKELKKFSKKMERCASWSFLHILLRVE
jgi:hypothetical protein